MTSTPSTSVLNGRVLLEHRVEAGDLLRLVVRVYCGFLDEIVELGAAASPFRYEAFLRAISLVLLVMVPLPLCRATGHAL